MNHEHHLSQNIMARTLSVLISHVDHVNEKKLIVDLDSDDFGWADKEAIYSGNFTFTSLENSNS